MVPLILFSAVTASLTSSGLVTAEDLISINGPLGSDLLLPVDEACTYSGSYRFDLLRGTEKIGAYDDGLQGLRSYKDRLTYDPETCAITLKRLRTEDATRFTVRLFYAINQKAIAHDIHYQVTINDPLTSRPTMPGTIQTHAERTSRNGSHVSDDGILSFISFCLLLDSAVNGVFSFLLLILRGCWNKLDKWNVNVACLINYLITGVSEICSMSTMHSGNSYIWILIVITIILVIDVIMKSLGYLPECLLKVSPITCFRNIFFCCTCCNDDPSSRCQRINRYLPRWLMLLIQVLVPILFGLLCFGNDKFSGREVYLFLSLFFSGVVRAAVFAILYCYKNKFKQVPQEDPTKPPDPTKTPGDLEIEMSLVRSR